MGNKTHNILIIFVAWFLLPLNAFAQNNISNPQFKQIGIFAGKIFGIGNNKQLYVADYTPKGEINYINPAAIDFMQIPLEYNGDIYELADISCNKKTNGICLIEGVDKKYNYALFAFDTTQMKYKFLKFGKYSRLHYFKDNLFYAVDLNLMRLTMINIDDGTQAELSDKISINDSLNYMYANIQTSPKLYPVIIDNKNNEFTLIDADTDIKTVKISAIPIDYKSDNISWETAFIQKTNPVYIPEKMQSSDKFIAMLLEYENGKATLKLSGVAQTEPSENLVDFKSINNSETGQTYAVIGTQNGLSPAILCTDDDNKLRFKPTIAAKEGYKINITGNTDNSMIISYENRVNGREFFFYNPENIVFPKKADCNSIKPINAAEIKSINKIRAKNSLAKLYFSGNFNDKSIKYIIIDVYGSNGLQSGDEFLPWMAGRADILNMSASVRGDADFGTKFALSGFSPNRINPVNDLLDLTEEIIKQRPDLKGKIILRGFSAGGWIAIRAAIQKPEFYSGTITGAGQYNVNWLGQKFVRQTDDDLFDKIQSMPTGCGGLRFLLLHGSNDNKIPPEQTEEIAEIFKQKKCKYRKEILQDFGHYIASDNYIRENMQAAVDLRNAIISLPVEESVQ